MTAAVSPRWPAVVKALDGYSGESASPFSPTGCKKETAEPSSSAPQCRERLAAGSCASRRWPAGMTPGLARLRANGGEAIRAKVLADDAAEMASVRAANDSAAIVANSGEELARILAAKRHGVGETSISPKPADGALSDVASKILRALI